MDLRRATSSSALIFLLLWSVLLWELDIIAAHDLFGKSRRHLSHLDKHVVTTIQTIHGDTYNCVDFYEQPAFDHPLLKNRKFDLQKINSSFEDLEVRGTNSSSYSGQLSNIWLNSKGCPIGTVPIRKIAKDDLLRASLAASVASNINHLNPGVHVAILRSTGHKRYHGGGMITSVYNHVVKDNQYTSSRFRFANGPDSIAVGWVVNPSLYRDTQTRLFIYTTTKDVQCYNTFCPGFVLSNQGIPIDVVLQPVSKRGGPNYEQSFFVRKDPRTGDWVLMFGAEKKVVGFWPRHIFNGLADFANYAEWGGEVYSPPGTLIPPMGSGCRPYKDIRFNGYARTITVMYENDHIEYDPAECKTHADISKYIVVDRGNVGGTRQRLVEFGGNNLLYDPNAPYAC